MDIRNICLSVKRQPCKQETGRPASVSLFLTKLLFGDHRDRIVDFHLETPPKPFWSCGSSPEPPLLIFLGDYTSLPPASFHVDLISLTGKALVSAGEEEGELGEYRQKLLMFLEISSYYDPGRLICDFPFDGECVA